MRWERFGSELVVEQLCGAALTAVEVDEEHSLEVSVVDQGRMHSRARLVVYREVTEVRVPPKQIELLLINDQLLQVTTRGLLTMTYSINLFILL